MQIDLILCHFNDFKFSVEPALSTFKKIFPDARVILYTDNKNFPYPKIIDAINVVDPIYNREHPRYGYWSSDLYRAIGLLESAADIAVYSDSDMCFYSDNAKYLIPLTLRFGFCIPANPRLLVRTDTLIGVDSDRKLDTTGGYGFAYNTTPLFYNTKSTEAKNFLEYYVSYMEKSPQRNPLVFYRAAYETKYVPYLLPFQWCVCSQNIGINDPIVLHIGHEDVELFYLKGKSLRYIKLRKYFLRNLSGFKSFLARIKHFIKRCLKYILKRFIHE